MSPASAKNKKDREFDPNTFLATIGEGKRMVAVPKKQTIFPQGDEADVVFYVQKGKVRLTVVSKTGKEATIGIVSEGIFLAKPRWRSGPPHGIRCRYDRLRSYADRQKGDDVGTARRTCIFRFVCRLFAGAEHPLGFVDHEWTT